MKYFINFDPVSGIHVSTYIQPGARFNSDITDTINDIREHRPSTCPLDGASDALCDGSIWTDSDQDAIEYVFNAINRKY